MTGNTPLAIGYGNGIGAPAGFLVATDRADALHHRLHRDGALHHHRRRVLRLHHPGSRPGVGHGLGRSGDDGLRRVRRLADRHLRLLQQHGARHLVRLGHQLADPCRDRHRRHRHLRLLRHQHRRRHPRSDAHRRGPAPWSIGVLRALQRRRSRRHGPGGSEPAECLQVAGGGRGRHRCCDRRAGRCRGQRGHRAVLRVLVLGRLRDDCGLWRGVTQPQAHRAQGDADRGRRARNLLHVRVLDDDRRQRQGDVDREGEHQRRSRCGSTWPRTSSVATSSATSTCSSS